MENIDSLTDEQALRRLLDDSDDLELRRRVRARLRQLKKEANPAIEIENCRNHDAKVVKPQFSSSCSNNNNSSSSSSQPNDRKTDGREFLERTNHLRSLPPSTKTSRPVSSPAPPQPESGVVLRRCPPPLRPSPVGDSSSSEGSCRRPESSGARLETVVLRKVEPKTTKTDHETTRPRSNAAAKVTTKTAFERFRQLDNCSDTSKRYLGVDGLAAKRSPSPNSIRDQMLNWCRARVSCYDDVSIDDFSSSWSDGLAFCALVHSFYPESFDFDVLDRKDKAKNFQLAFDTAEKQAGVFPLLEVEDMVKTNSPDWKCVFTYVNCFANRMSEIRKEKKAAELLLQLKEKELGQERQTEQEDVK